MSAPELDQVVLLDEAFSPVGVCDRATVHTSRTPLHLAFSCYLFDTEGRVLVTRRALSKRTWPGVWTNSFCGHPRPGEAARAAVERRGAEELGLHVQDLELLVPNFRYRAIDSSGIVENELCPIWVGRAGGEPAPNPAEVADVAWTPWGDLVAVATTTPWLLSPWSVLQVRQLQAAFYARDEASAA